MTGEELDVIRRRADAATHGPWTAVTDNGRKDGIGIVGQVAKRGTGEAIAVFAGVGGNRHADATFTACARDDVPTLLAEVDRLRAVADAAVVWRRQFEKPARGPRERALFAAVDQLTGETS